MAIEEKFLKAIKEIKKSEKKVNFDQTIDLVINLKNFDIRREAFGLFITLPHKIKDKKIAGFFEKDSELIDTIRKDNFSAYKEKKDIKDLIKKYDFFIANAKLMPAIATVFGRVLGPVGKMPSPQLGIVTVEEDKIIQTTVNKINSTLRVRVKEPSIKIGIAKESMADEEIMENALTVYNEILKSLPKKNENIKNIKFKLTMGAPVNIKI